MPPLPPPWPRRGLYAITPDEPDTARLRARVEPVLAAGASLLQYRNKAADARLRKEQATALAALCRTHGVPLLVNDDWRLAASLGVGAHLGGDDGSLAAVRRALGDGAILGASCYDSLERAHAAIDHGASYVAFGAFLPSSTKPLARRAHLGLLGDPTLGDVPRVAIGGITPAVARDVIAAGADLVAVVGGLFDAPDPHAAARAYIDCFEDPVR